MYVKGTAVKSIQEFVQTKHAAKYDEWLRTMPDSARSIMAKPVFVSDWYPVKDAAIEPTVAIGKVLYAGDAQKAGWETGRYSSETALSGIYKIFVKMATPQFIIGGRGKYSPHTTIPPTLRLRKPGPGM
jgi:hypothetical protein